MALGRSNDQCRDRWTHTLDPANGKSAGKWIPEEDVKLSESVKKYDKEWVKVAAMVPGRTNNQCGERWCHFLDPAIDKGRWTPAEDAKLTEAVKNLGKKWVEIAALLPGRTNEQCLKRWTQTLDRAIDKKGKFTPEENAKLAEAVKKHDKEWVAVAALLPGRTNTQCRERWIDCLDPAIDKGKFTPEEGERPTEAVKKHGKDWISVAAMLPGRTNTQCRTQWVNTSGPGNDRSKWTPEEDARMTEAVKNLGKKWVKVAALLFESNESSVSSTMGQVFGSRPRIKRCGGRT